jgi:hypothetical protein
MSNRYNNAPIQTDSARKRKIGTYIISLPDNDAADLYIQVTSVDRLDILASKLYGDQRLWYIIAAANGLGKGSLIVQPDTVLRIPNRQLAEQNINKLNSER